MAVATGTALLIGAGISAGTQIVGAAKQAGAVKEAAKTQAASADKALALQKQMYEQQRADEAPYLGLGSGAVGALQHGLGLTPMPAAAPATPATPAPAPPTAIRRPGPPQGALGMFAGGPQGSGLPPGSTGAGVPMRSPNGQMKSVPPDQVAHYQQLGAQVV